jgi:hypothetical protein
MKKKLEEHAVKGEKVDLVKFYSCATFDIMVRFFRAVKPCWR